MQKPKVMWDRRMGMWLCHGNGLFTFEHSIEAAFLRWAYFQNVLENLKK